MKSVLIRCEGRVQGVWFRASTKEVADDLSILGWVKNEADGSVTVRAVGEAGAINKLIDWCHEGPQYAKVDRVIAKDVEEEVFGEFLIRRF